MRLLAYVVVVAINSRFWIGEDPKQIFHDPSNGGHHGSATRVGIPISPVEICQISLAFGAVGVEEEQTCIGWLCPS
jgi:hypothetical protein